ncbi:RICIN domain-containing protein [Actinocrispum wychmicini]|uniref:Ricin-type beta-trefoil lectin protein n=1 Tax=Actinocrispum wychmicini TaxID=1213861 RepID=A0A4R2JAD1_9PSEU|nr:RICIN domain-containing protein [Actinocrispum wychmicini]TCO53608.1 ricin-type beta-trefoil lectin protein [Actinocrispum wychmicini]
MIPRVVVASAILISVVVPAPAAAASVDPNTWYTVTAANSGKCVDARAAGTANGTVVQQFTCNGTGSQQWQLQPTDSGYYRVNTFNNPALSWDVTNVSTADGGLIQLWTYGNGDNQQWMPVQEASGAYHFVSRNSGKCLDVPGASTADSQQLQQFACNGTAAQSFTLTAVGSPPGNGVDLGPNVVVFDPSMSSASVQSRLDSVFGQQETNQFGTNRYALLFKPGTYNVTAKVGFFTQVAGLGMSPDDVTVNGGVHVDANWFPPHNATQNFWRSAENLSVTPAGGTDEWAVSQAAPYRRMHVRGNLKLDDGGWASGGWMSDTKVDGQVQSGSQQQWISRNTQWGSWTGSNWNMVFVGAQNAPSGNFPSPPYTRVATTPVVREKPFLYVDGGGTYNVFVPALRTNSSGITWAGTQPGSSLPIDQFFVVRPGATAAQINAALAAGRNLLVTPGVYHLNQPLNITRPDTVVLGLGLATFVPDNGITAVNVADVDGVQIAGLLIQAGPVNSPTLMVVGPTGSTADHSADPTSLHDVFFQIGGNGVGKATQSLVINSDNVIGDHTWIWRADHTDGVGWTVNTAANGLVVNGDNVTFYGLFVEHFQQYNVIWNGNGGRTYFFQNELPYDPPNQAAYMNGSTRGWAAYKVGANVTSHEAWGLGSYCFFNANPGVVADRSFEVPNTAGVKFHDMVTVSLGGTGTIAHIINSTGGPSNSGSNVANLVSYP